VPTDAMRAGDFRGLIDSQGRQLKLYDPWSTDPVTWERDQFSYNGQLNVIDPSLISPLAAKLFAITPKATSAINPVVDYNWLGPEPYVRRDWTVTTRFDHRLSDNDQVYVRYAQGDYFRHSQFYSQPMLDGVAGTVRRVAPNKSGVISWVHTFSPTFFNEWLGSVSREFWWKGTGAPGVKYADELGLPNPFDVQGWPGLYSGGLYGNDYYFETDNTQSSPFLFGIIDDNATKIAGKHELQFGFHYRWDQLNLLPDQQHPQGNHSWNTNATALYDSTSSRTDPDPLERTGYRTANMYLGLMNYSNQMVRTYFYTRAKEISLYFQDNFKVTPRLTLNLGLRYEYWPALREKNYNMTGFDPASKSIILANDLQTMYDLGATFPAVVEQFESLGVKFISYKEAGRSRLLTTAPKANLGPRLGFAYRMGQGARSLVLRGGYRISYFRIPARAWTATMRSNAPLRARFRYSVTDSQYTPDQIGQYGMRSVPTVIGGQNSREVITMDSVKGLGLGSAGAVYFEQHQPLPRVQDWNFTVEKEVMQNTVFRATYVGNHGSNLETSHYMNENIDNWVWYNRTREPRPSGAISNVARRPWNIENNHFIYGTLREYMNDNGFSNYSGGQFELERRYSDGFGFQVFWNIGNALMAGGRQWSDTSRIYAPGNFMPGAVPTNLEERMRFKNYRRDSGIPKHRVRWNWIVDLPFGRGKPLGRNVGGLLNRVIGGWQIAGMGNLRTNWFSLPTGYDRMPTGVPVEIYGEKYPIQDCRPGRSCRPGFLWWNGYIPANQINSVDANGQPNGYMGVPSNYQPAVEPLIPWPADPDGDTRIAPDGKDMSSYFGTSNTWITLNNGHLQRQGLSLGPYQHPLYWQYMPNNRRWGLDASVLLNADFFNVLNHPAHTTSVGSNGIKDRKNSGQSAREVQLTLRLTW
jgi:hypothetical protein